MSDEHGWGAFDHDPGFSHDPDSSSFEGHDSAPFEGHDPGSFEGHDSASFESHDGFEPPAAFEPHDDPAPAADHSSWDEQGPPEHHDDTLAEVTAGHTLGPVGADPDATDPAETLSAFPPLVDVGALPEPVDGFPWIDTGSLGIVEPAALTTPAAPVTPADLAAYAAEDLPPAADPWAALAASEDPATGALARWWHPDTPA